MACGINIESTKKPRQCADGSLRSASHDKLLARLHEIKGIGGAVGLLAPAGVASGACHADGSGMADRARSGHAEKNGCAATVPNVQNAAAADPFPSINVAGPDGDSHAARDAWGSRTPSGAACPLVHVLPQPLPFGIGGAAWQRRVRASGTTGRIDHAKHDSLSQSVCAVGNRREGSSVVLCRKNSRPVNGEQGGNPAAADPFTRETVSAPGLPGTETVVVGRSVYTREQALRTVEATVPRDRGYSTSTKRTCEESGLPADGFSSASRTTRSAMGRLRSDGMEGRPYLSSDGAAGVLAISRTPAAEIKGRNTRRVIRS